MKKYKKRKILLIFVLLLIAFRLYLPTLVKNYLNNVLAELPGYTGAVEDVDIALIRGAYVIKGLHLSVLEAETEIPFIRIAKADISVEWKSLFKGKIVSEIILNEPEITYVMEDQEGTEGAKQEDWTKALLDIVPLDINHFEIHNGQVGLLLVSAEPKVDLKLTNIELTADNLRNVVAAKHTLPSPINLSATTFGEGNLSIKGKMNLLKEIPDMDISLELEKSSVTALNDFTKHYANIDFESGIFNVYSEVVIADSYLKGYVKPFITDSKLLGEKENVLETVWEGFVGFFKFVLKNQKTNSIAMKVPFEGNLDNVETSVWVTVASIVKNGWIKAFDNKVDNSIEFKDALKDANKNSKSEKKKNKN